MISVASVLLKVNPNNRDGKDNHWLTKLQKFQRYGEEADEVYNLSLSFERTCEPSWFNLILNFFPTKTSSIFSGSIFIYLVAKHIMSFYD